MKIIAVLSILLVFFGSMHNLYAAEQYAQKNLKSIPKVVRYIAYGVGIFCSGYVIRILLWTLI